MNKYIDAEKLIAEIERRKAILDKYKGSFETAACCKQELEWMKDLITSLQQEQPEMDLKEDVKRWKDKHGVVGMDDLWLEFACYFWNRGYNARKEG